MGDEMVMKKKVEATFKDLTNKDIVLGFLTRHQIVPGGEIHSLELYERGEDQKGVIVTVKDEVSAGTMNVLIDVKVGQPSTEQVYNALYEKGKNCSKRIIAFTGGASEADMGNPSADELVVSSLIACMNQYPLGLYLVKMPDWPVAEVADLEPFEIFLHPSTHPLRDLPSKEAFREAEFWYVFYDSLNVAFYQPWTAFDSGIMKTSECGEWCDIDGIRVYVCWNEKGAFFTVRPSHCEEEYVTPIWKLKEAELKRRYSGREIGLISIPGKLPSISIRFWDLPLSWLWSASIKERIAKAKVLHREFYELRVLMDCALSDLKESRKQEASSESPAETYKAENQFV